MGGAGPSLDLIGGDQLNVEAPLYFGINVAFLDFLTRAAFKKAVEKLPHDVNFGHVARRNVGRNAESPGMGQFARKRSKQLELNFQGLLGFEVSDSDLHDRDLRFREAGHHDGFSLCLGLFVFCFHFLLLLDEAAHSDPLVVHTQIRNDEVWVGGQGVMNFKVLVKWVVVLLDAGNLGEIVAYFDSIVGLLDGEKAGRLILRPKEASRSHRKLKMVLQIHIF